MTSRGDDLKPCTRKGCPWRGTDPRACPLHADDDAWELQSHLMPEGYSSRAKTRHRRR